ncbi:hypothetical protein LTR70_008636 [Exophiala xenobiotica]|uniref:Uncharacterized protein n=1 Tax=Lithohypha guttulata TaxID=1690604 RepID=A0ABR0JZV2_9EURO|nr:hypothetical protein LTR24_008471 [Lithohypha guttulata]KAK5311650.1 hypothetical protein LTR70_008636 [Exophiala xenobiotica]
MMELRVVTLEQTTNDTSYTLKGTAKDLTQNVLAGYALSDTNSFNNNNNPPAPDNIYPQKQPGDAPYVVPESQLRAALYIPPEFTFGQKRPILFVPGTGAFGGVNFISNLGKFFGNDDRFDPVYFNIPGAQYNDTQISSETTLPSSHGHKATSTPNGRSSSGHRTRPVVTDFISASADFHGSTLAYFLDPALVDPPLPPSVIQRAYDSDFVLAFRAGGGGSPCVKSTSVWSITDAIVQPQYSPYASAAYFSQDLPGTPNTQSPCPTNLSVPYTNNQIQTVCQGRPAGGTYTHQGVLYHPLTYALALDALTNDGPGDINRIDLDTVCNQLIAPGLSLEDVLATEGLIPLAVINLLLYRQKVTDEPAVRQYAVQVNGACAMAGGNTTTSRVPFTTSVTSRTTTPSMTVESTTKSGTRGSTSSGSIKPSTAADHSGPTTSTNSFKPTTTTYSSGTMSSTAWADWSSSSSSTKLDAVSG